MQYIVQVDFPYTGPFGDEMAQAFTDLAHDIANESGLIWKIWTENAQNNTAGGIYLFDNEADARRYIQKHTQRLESFGLTNIRAALFEANQKLSHITKAPL
ncbi:monooxygenase [Sulfuricurvum sp.]|uniref:monooxygenase n=1 Tax=Sulfuricurvum sp. TaxID=2025608 RepID=UPI003C6A156B